MWIATQHGFYSVVENTTDRETVLVRARIKADLERVTKHIPWNELAPITDSPKADYPHRRVMTKKQWADFLWFESMEIDYSNFKDRVGKHDRRRAHVYLDVWSTMMRLERLDKEKLGKKGKGDSQLSLDDYLDDMERQEPTSDWERWFYRDRVEDDDEDGPFDENEPYQCDFCGETVVGYYEKCPWCNEPMWEYEASYEADEYGP